MAKGLKHPRYYNRLATASKLLSDLAQAESMQPSIVTHGRLSGSKLTNPIDEDITPETIIDKNYVANNTVDVTPDILESLAAQDEVADAIDRIISYIVMVPEIGTSFAYPQFKNDFEIDPVDRDAKLAEISTHWQILQNLMFNNSSSLTIGIHKFVHDWFTYGDIYVGIIREKMHGNILRICIQHSPFVPVDDGKNFVYYTTESGDIIWELEDTFKLGYAEINAYHKSYVASLRYAYNTYKSIERTRIANAIMAAQFRTLYTVPTKGLGKVKARARLSSVMGLYKRTIDIDRGTGEVLVNGENSYPVNTELWISETSSGAVKIDNPSDGNPQLNNTDLVEYFFRKFYKQSKLPISKYEAVNTGYLNGLSELDEDERQFRLAIAKHRSVLSRFFRELLWRLISVKPEFAGRNEIHDAIVFTFYDEPEHKTDIEYLEGINDKMSKVNDIMDTYLEVLEKAGFNESQKTARANVLRYKLMSKYCPEILEQTVEDYRNVPEQETSESDDFGTSDSGSDETGGFDDFNNSFDDGWGDDSGFNNGNDSMDDWDDSQIDSESGLDDFDWSGMDSW